MYENVIRAVRWGDKTPAFGYIEPFALSPSKFCKILNGFFFTCTSVQLVLIVKFINFSRKFLLCKIIPRKEVKIFQSFEIFEKIRLNERSQMIQLSFSRNFFFKWTLTTCNKGHLEKYKQSDKTFRFQISKDKISFRWLIDYMMSAVRCIHPFGERYFPPSKLNLPLPAKTIPFRNLPLPVSAIFDVVLSFLVVF